MTFDLVQICTLDPKIIRLLLILRCVLLTLITCLFCLGAVNKRFGIDEERKAVPLTLRVAYNKVLLHTSMSLAGTFYSCIPFPMSGGSKWKEPVEADSSDLHINESLQSL